ncbi:MAG: hypothetical protein ACXVNN_00380 [Bacteroidia bacterium]
MFGIIHDQITYTISHEYFTKFKFVQFGLIDEGMRLQMSDRSAAVIVGIMATWWVGIPIGLMYAFILMFFKDETGLYKIYFRTILLTFVLTILISFAGYLNWKFHLQYIEAPDWYYPENLIDKNHFICVGNIHNFSYLGGGIGTIAGIIYLIIQKGKENISERNFSVRKKI